MAVRQDVFQVEGMSCNHCKMAVEKEVGKLAGVQSAAVDLDAKTLTVSYDPAKTSDAEIRGAVEEAGFTAL